MTVREFKEKNKIFRDNFIKNAKEINDMEKEINRLNDEVKGLELKREELFVFSRKQITLVIRFLMLIALGLSETAFFMIFGPQILAIPDILIKTMFGLLALFSGGVMAFCINKFTNDIIRKSLMVSDKNIIDSDEYKEYSQIIKDKEMEKNKIFNELINKRNEIKYDALDNCKNLIRVNEIMREDGNENSLIDEVKPLRKIRILNKRN